MDSAPINPVEDNNHENGSSQRVEDLDIVESMDTSQVDEIEDEEVEEKEVCVVDCKKTTKRKKKEQRKD